MKYWNKTFLALAAITTIGIAIIGISACEKTSETLEIVDPADVKGERTLTVRTLAADGSVVDGFDLVIEGPTSWSGRVSGSSYTLENVENGKYTIRISGNGWLERIEQLDYKGSSLLYRKQHVELVTLLTRANTADPEPGSDGYVINVPSPDGDPEKTITVYIPSGALSSVGLSQISITQDVPVKVFDHRETGWYQISNKTIVCKPNGLVFTEPIEITIPVPDGVASEELLNEFRAIQMDSESGKYFPTENTPEFPTRLSSDGKYLLLYVTSLENLAVIYDDNVWFRHTPNEPGYTRWQLIDESSYAGENMPDREVTVTEDARPTDEHAWQVFCDRQRSISQPVPCVEYFVTNNSGTSKISGPFYSFLWLRYLESTTEVIEINNDINPDPPFDPSVGSNNIIFYDSWIHLTYGSVLQLEWVLASNASANASSPPNE